jgi:hypothetical protein
MTNLTRRLLATAALLGLVPRSVRTAQAQQTPASPPPAPGEANALLTVFLRHDESKTLSEINAHLKQTGFFRSFPPPGIVVESWYVMMGIGQVVTMRVPPERLREVNHVLEDTAWGGYRTEFYPTYDYRQAAADIRRQMQ